MQKSHGTVRDCGHRALINQAGTAVNNRFGKTELATTAAEGGSSIFGNGIPLNFSKILQNSGFQSSLARAAPFTTTPPPDSVGISPTCLSMLKADCSSGKACSQVSLRMSFAVRNVEPLPLFCALCAMFVPQMAF